MPSTPLAFAFLILLSSCAATPSGPAGPSTSTDSNTGSTASAEEVDEGTPNPGPTRDAPVGGTEGTVGAPPPDSVCRGYSLPDRFEAPKGCVVSGPYPGEVAGTPLGEEQELAEALTVCLAESTCTHVVAEWYVGAKFRPVEATGGSGAKLSTDSYGCVFILEGCQRD